MNNPIAQTILAQLGGNRFIAMTGARDLVAGSNSLQMRLPRAGANGANIMRVTLSTTDTYLVEFWNRRGLNVRRVAMMVGVYADQLRGLFTEQTGLHTSL